MDIVEILFRVSKICKIYSFFFSFILLLVMELYIPVCKYGAVPIYEGKSKIKGSFFKKKGHIL
jgi:hypothetical protein